MLLAAKPTCSSRATSWLRSMRQLPLALLLLASLSSPALAAESPTSLEIPQPVVFLQPDSISFAVLQARPEDEGFQKLLDTAWQGLQQSKSGATSGFMGVVLKVIQGQHSNALMSFLPLQMVRVDSLDTKTGLPHPTMAVTVSGWAGLQVPLYSMMTRNPEGQPLPTKDLEEATLVLREGWKDPTRSHVLTRVKGTIVSFPTVEKAESVVKAMASPSPATARGAIHDLLQTLDTQHDTYGVLLNRQGSLLRFLTWLNKSDVSRAIEAVGQDRMQRVIDTISSMTWEGDLRSDDEMGFFLRFHTSSPEARKELAALLKDVRGVLDRYGRAGEMRTTGMGNELHVDFTMVGYREMMTSYLRSAL